MGKWLMYLSFFALLAVSCRKDAFITGAGAGLRLSADTVSFDTLFVNSGSPTQQVLVYNPNDQKLRLSDISLSGGAASYFSININGTPGPVATDQVLEAGDSLYVFVTANLPVNGQSAAFGIADSIRISFNGNTQWVQLRAYGRNAHFFTNVHVTKDSSWTSELPFVVNGGVTVDTGVTLTIAPGTRLYFHAGAGLIVNGTLKVSGMAGSGAGVSFTGDRLDAPYNTYPGSWPGIYFGATSKANLVQFATISNADQAVVVENASTDGNPKLQLLESRVDNALDAGIVGFQSSIYARNCLVSNCGRNILLLAGGQYQFVHCTAATYSTPVLSHQFPVLTVSDAGTAGTQVVSGAVKSSFTNCIFWGDANLVDELAVDKETSAGFQLLLDHSVLKQTNFPASTDSSALLLNQDPVFQEIDGQKRNFDFHLQSASPAIDQGAFLGVTLDLDGSPRPVGKPDIGCYERQ